MPSIIRSEAKEAILSALESFKITDEDMALRAALRDKFKKQFSLKRIETLKPEQYFPGQGEKENCMGYQLEWGTLQLSSIKGGSMAKYGPITQFSEIKDLLLLLLKATASVDFYDEHGGLTKHSKDIIRASQKINGMKSGRTVLGKILSIYYPAIFLPFFSDQDYLLEKILQEHSSEVNGLELYLENNYKFIRIKTELLNEPVFNARLKNRNDEHINDFFYKFIYSCFPHIDNYVGNNVQPSDSAELKIEALETQHYQTLIHRNFKKLFPGFRYCDPDAQGEQTGHYPTEDAGTLDFLCFDENNDYVVIELKRKGTDVTVGQICRYMGWVKENLVQGSQKVKGIIIAEEKDPKLEYAVKVIPYVDVRKMHLDVTISNFK